MERSPKSRSWPVGLGIVVILFLVGFPFFGFGAYEGYKTYKMVNASVETEGIVVGNYIDYEGDYRPEVRFTTEDGEVVRFTDGVASYPAQFEEGETVSVIYDPGNVRDARINRWFRIWFVPLLLMTIGVLPLLSALGLYVMIRGFSFLSRRGQQRS